jgi:hypothetical protein
LLDLQKADQELRRLEGEKDAHDRGLRVRAQQVEKQKHEIEALRARHKQARLQADRKELDVRGKRDQIARLRQQQMQIKDNRQFAALQNEIKFAELAVSKLEDEILNDYEDIEAIEAETAAAAAELQRQQQQLDAYRRQVEQEKDELDAQVEACRRQRQAIEERLPPDVVEQFHRIADRWDGAALAPVVVQEGEKENVFSCGGCNMSVTQNCYVLLRGRSEGLITCPNCSRILYVEDA